MSELQVVLFSAADQMYGVPVTQVQSIERLVGITAVPNTLSFIQGVIQLRGEIVPVLSLRLRVGAPVSTEREDEQRIIVVRLAEMLVGLVVDAVHDVKAIAEESIQPPPNLVGGLEARYLHGIAAVEDRTLVLLNLEKILSEAQEKQLAEVERSIRGE